MDTGKKMEMLERIKLMLTNNNDTDMTWIQGVSWASGS